MHICRDHGDVEEISCNNKARSTRKLDTGRNTFAMQAIHNPASDEIREDMAQMRTDLWLVLKHIGGGAKKVNAVNYLTKIPRLADEFYYK